MGKYILTFTIDKSDGATGDSMAFGVADAIDHGPAFGFNPNTGCLYVWTDSTSHNWGSATDTHLMAGNLRGQTDGAIVQMFVDLESRSLSVSVNGEKASPAQKLLPQSVRPWANLCRNGDTLTLSGLEIWIA